MKLNRKHLRRMILKEIYSLNEEDAKEDSKNYPAIQAHLSNINPAFGIAYTASSTVRVLINQKVKETGTELTAAGAAIKSVLKKISNDIQEIVDKNTSDIMQGFKDLFN